MFLLSQNVYFYVGLVRMDDWYSTERFASEFDVPTHNAALKATNTHLCVPGISKNKRTTVTFHSSEYNQGLRYSFFQNDSISVINICRKVTERYDP
jgi:hypothetical protein